MDESTGRPSVGFVGRTHSAPQSRHRSCANGHEDHLQRQETNALACNSIRAATECPAQWLPSGPPISTTARLGRHVPRRSTWPEERRNDRDEAADPVYCVSVRKRCFGANGCGHHHHAPVSLHAVTHARLSTQRSAIGKPRSAEPCGYLKNSAHVRFPPRWLPSGIRTLRRRPGRPNSALTRLDTCASSSVCAMVQAARASPVRAFRHTARLPPSVSNCTARCSTSPSGTGWTPGGASGSAHCTSGFSPHATGRPRQRGRPKVGATRRAGTF